MIISEYKNRHNASFLRLVRSMADERWVYDSIDYQLMDMYYYEDYILMNEDYITLVAESSKGEIVGFCVGAIRLDSVDITMLFVEEKSRRKGYGKLLKEQIASHAYGLGKRSITAHNSYSNSASLQLNYTMGWCITPVGEKDEILGVSKYYKAELVFDNNFNNINGEKNESN